MNIGRGSKRGRCLARVILFLISAALITGMTGCTSADTDPSSPVWYTLTVSSTAGGEVKAPGEGVFTYEGARSSVSLVAGADTGYRFDRWTGDTGAIADVNAASTTITVDGDYSITANFVDAEEYTLTIASTDDGEVIDPGEGAFTYYEDTVVDLVARPNPGHRFDRWTGDTGAIADVNSKSTTITINGDYSITASFVEAEEYTLTIASTAGGEVGNPGEGAFTYDDGTVVDLVAIPATGYVFFSWSGDTGTIDDVNDASTTITMDDNYSITANFAEVEEYTLTIASTTGGEVTDPGEGPFTYDDGTAVDLVAIPATGYVFVNWTGDTGTIDDVNAASTTITMNADYSITANFAEAEEYTLTISSTAGGEVTDPGEGAFTYDDGTVVDLVATPATGYVFVNWTGDAGAIADANAASTTITMNADYSISANFAEAEEYTLTIASTTGGEVTGPGEGAFTYEEGTVVDLVATPATDYVFVNWTGDTGTIADVNADSTTITMNADYSITAGFAEIEEYTLTIASTAGGEVTDPGEGPFTYDEGTVVDLVATPASGYVFVNWTGDTGAIADVNAASTTITINGNYSITANFDERPTDQYQLIISSTDGGSVVTPGEGALTYEEGTVVDLVATAATGYVFVNWTGDTGTIADINAPSTTITMNADYSITANFAQVEGVAFPDPNLEAVIREAIEKPTGPIYESDLEGLTSLSATYKDIADLTGLEYCINLTWLDLRNNRISDISALAGLTSLTYLNLDYNSISDVSHLANLTELKWLYLSRNMISDISPLGNLTGLLFLYIHTNQISVLPPLPNLTSLTRLIIFSNQIEDISHLADLTKLTWLYVNNNDLSDISSLTGLTRLIRVQLSHNSISDIEPLVDNTGLGEGDTVWLEGNPLSAEADDHIDDLRARGVTVYY